MARKLTEYELAVKKALDDMFPLTAESGMETVEITPSKLYQAAYRIAGKGMRAQSKIEWHIAEEMAASLMGLTESQLEKLRQGKTIKRRKRKCKKR